MPAYAVTIFIGAFLLFQVQPLIGKYILPWFGGGPGVWTTCMLFFQIALLAGYAYAHFSSRFLKVRSQVILHLFLVGVSLALLPIIPQDSWKPRPMDDPVIQIWLLLLAALGLPYFVLSSTGPLLQQWFSRTHAGASPYRLYSLSNAGSLLALVSYPFFVETHFTRKTQGALWGWGLLLYAIGCAFCALKLWRMPAPSIDSAKDLSNINDPQTSPTIAQKLLWLALPACASILLLATTNKLCQDVAVIPFLWVLPLALYLLSFVICFDNPRWYVRLPFTLALIAALSGICWALFKGAELPMRKQIALYAGGLFICCMVCHGELYRLRPAPRHLTSFYLMIAAGGAAGGMFVGIVAPLCFTNYYELHWGLFLCGFLFVVVCWREGTLSHPKEWRWLACVLPLIVFGGLDWFLARLGSLSSGFLKTGVWILRIGMWSFLLVMIGSWLVRRKFRIFPYWHFLACLWLTLGLVALGTTLWLRSHRSDPEIVYASRNFYGVLTVYEHRKEEAEGHHFLLQHGRITHGLQFVAPAQALWPTTYYARQSGLGLAIESLPSTARRIGVVGLGTGSIAAYARPGDYLRFYEINPQVKALATRRFTYCVNCRATIDIAPGDARLSMETEPAQQFDLLALDAFSSDAIPVHLLTKEAFELYGRHLKTNGIIAVHVSNHYLNLEPVVLNLARAFNYNLAAVDYDETDEEWWLYSSTWILLTRNQAILNSPAIHNATSPTAAATKIPLWTDDFASLFQILK